MRRHEMATVANITSPGDEEGLSSVTFVVVTWVDDAVVKLPEVIAANTALRHKTTPPSAVDAITGLCAPYHTPCAGNRVNLGVITVVSSQRGGWSNATGASHFTRSMPGKIPAQDHLQRLRYHTQRVRRDGAR